jgi:tetratricopeptide (TPR) repeat protein
MPGTQMTSPALIRGREASQEKAWKDAHAFLHAADKEAPLGVDDLERLGEAAYLLGHVADAASTQERAHREALRSGDLCRAVRHAFWLGLGLLDQGEHAQAGGWFARAERILHDADVDCVERGYLLMPSALGSVTQGDHETAFATYVEASTIAERFGDADLATLARVGQGEEKIALGDVRAGVALLDEAMVAVRADEVSPIVVGIVYCSVIDTFQAIFDIRRAQEWTTA